MRQEAGGTSNPGAAFLFNLEGVLASGIELAFEQLSDAQLDRLRREIEVARKLYARYESDLSLPATTKTLSRQASNSFVPSCCSPRCVVVMRGFSSRPRS